MPFRAYAIPRSHVKEADKDIIAMIKGAGRLVDHSNLVHSYPFCWRSDTPLIYRAVPSWFVAVESFKDRLLANNAVGGRGGLGGASLESPARLPAVLKAPSVFLLFFRCCVVCVCVWGGGGTRVPRRRFGGGAPPF